LGATNSRNSCVFDIVYEFLWWSVHKKFLLEENFYEQTLYSFLSNNKHDNNDNANTNRDAFAVDYVGKY